MRRGRDTRDKEKEEENRVAARGAEREREKGKGNSLSVRKARFASHDNLERYIVACIFTRSQSYKSRVRLLTGGKGAFRTNQTNRIPYIRRGVNIFVPTSFDPTFLQIETKREKKKKIGTSLSLLSAILDETREIKGEKISTNCIK